MKQVSVTSCASYDESLVKTALCELLAPIGGLDWVEPGMRVAIKANLVSMMKPDAAATTHPALLCALVEMLTARGCRLEQKLRDPRGTLQGRLRRARFYLYRIP